MQCDLQFVKSMFAVFNGLLGITAVILGVMGTESIDKAFIPIGIIGIIASALLFVDNWSVIKQLNSSLSSLNQENTNLKDEITQVKQNNDALTRNNADLANNVKKFGSLNSNLKTIIQTMAQSMDDSKELAKTLQSSIDKIEVMSNEVEKSSEIMQSLVLELGKAKFDEVDTDRDGTITKTEWTKHFGGITRSINRSRDPKDSKESRESKKKVQIL